MRRNKDQSEKNQTKWLQYSPPVISTPSPPLCYIPLAFSHIERPRALALELQDVVMSLSRLMSFVI